MTTVPSIIIATAAHQAALNAVWQAQGRGTAFGLRPLVAAGTEGPTVAYLSQDMSATPAQAEAWQAYAATGDLPDLPPGVSWGEDGVIPAADAIAAHVGLTVVVPEDDVPEGEAPPGWADSVIAAHGYAWPPAVGL